MKLTTATSSINMVYGPGALSSLPEVENKNENETAPVTTSDIKGSKSSGDKIKDTLMASIGTMIFGYWGVYGTSCAISQLVSGSVGLLAGLGGIAIFAAIGLLGAYVACMSVYSLATGKPNKILPGGNDGHEVKSENQPVSLLA